MATNIPADPDTWLRRKVTSAALAEKGYPVAEKTLASMVCRGGGPPFRKFGRIPLYQWCTSLAWAESRLAPPRRTSSEPDAWDAATRDAVVPIADDVAPETMQPSTLSRRKT